MKLIVCATSPTANDCCARGADLNFLLPGWLASMVHVPTPTRATVVLLAKQTDPLPPPIDRCTGRPELAFADTA